METTVKDSHEVCWQNKVELIIKEIEHSVTFQVWDIQE